MEKGGEVLSLCGRKRTEMVVEVGENVSVADIELFTGKIYIYIHNNSIGTGGVDKFSRRVLCRVFTFV